MAMGWAPRRHVAIITATTSVIEDFMEQSWQKLAQEELSDGILHNVIGTRCLGTKRWHTPYKFSHGPGCLKRVQQAMRDGAVELRVHYETRVIKLEGT